MSSIYYIDIFLPHTQIHISHKHKLIYHVHKSLHTYIPTNTYKFAYKQNLLLTYSLDQVFYVDYGNTNIVKFDKLRSKLSFSSTPRGCLVFNLLLKPVIMQYINILYISGYIIFLCSN